MSDEIVQSGSFRDPSGFVFFKEGKIYRQINKRYQTHYESLMQSGLYEKLNSENKLIKHSESTTAPVFPDEAYKIIEPEPIPFISYPYEWCFSQLKDAALLTLEIQKIALDHGMILKDASAYNIQFYKGMPVLIDTLSFENYEEGRPWIAYKQFCQHFLAPLALMTYCHVDLGKTLRIHLDGIPLDITSRLLPKRTKFVFSLLTHIHMHAKSQKKYEGKSIDKSNSQISLRALRGIVDNLGSAVNKLTWQPGKTEWGDYYSDTNYSEESFRVKKKIIEQYLLEILPKKVWDLGANTGEFSRIVSSRNIPVVSFDIDPAAVEKNYLQCKQDNETDILPLLCDLTNPSPGIGWNNGERDSLTERCNADTILALALIHHLAISNNLPFDMIASFFNKLGKHLIIEFVPKEDSQVQRLLKSRDDIFNRYTQQDFERTFSKYYTVINKELIAGSKRTVYLMRKRD